MGIYNPGVTRAASSLGSLHEGPVEVRCRGRSIEAEILEIHWQGGIETLRQKNPVVAPHWVTALKDAIHEENAPADFRYDAGSKRPGVYLVKAKAGTNNRLKVKIKIRKSSCASPELTLKGNLNGLLMEGKCRSEVGEHWVDAEIKNLPESLARYEGDARWALEGQNMDVRIDTKTRLEVYVLLDKPGQPFAQGVWIEALRFLFRHAKVKDSKTGTDAIKKITDYCHGEHGMAYDTIMGSPRFNGFHGMNGSSSFELMKYMKKEPVDPYISTDTQCLPNDGKTVNCYDQACAVYSLSAALGIRSGIFYTQPFGYIKPTHLVGVGRCNNPFFRGNRTPPMIASDSPNRTGFGNHAYAHLSEKVEDACAGPHHNEGLDEYLRSSVDAKTSIERLTPRSIGMKLQKGTAIRLALEGRGLSFGYFDQNRSFKDIGMTAQDFYYFIESLTKEKQGVASAT